jgi:hypothetical protein
VLGIVDGDSRHGTTYQGQLKTATEAKKRRQEPPRAHTMTIIAHAVSLVADTMALSRAAVQRPG